MVASVGVAATRGEVGPFRDSFPVSSPLWATPLRCWRDKGVVKRESPGVLDDSNSGAQVEVGNGRKRVREGQVTVAEVGTDLRIETQRDNNVQPSSENLGPATTLLRPRPF